MARDWGNVPLNSVIPFFFDTFDGGTGASITLTGLAVTDIEIYKGTSVTQRSSDAGVALIDTDGIDIDTLTGIHGFSVDTSDNTDAGFYAVGSFYTVVVASVTIDAQTVNFVAGSFRLTAAEGVAGVPDVNVTHVGDTAQTAGDLKASLNTAQTDLDAIEAAVITNAAGVDIAADIIAVKAETAAILVDTGTTLQGEVDGIQATLGVAGAGLTDLGGMSTTMKGQVQTEAEDALVTHRLDELLNADSDIDGLAPPTVGSVFHEVLSKTAGSFTYDQTTDSLEAIRDKETDIETDTAVIGVAGAGLTAIDLPDQTMNITGNLSGSVGSVTGAVGSVTGAVTVGTNNDKTGYALSSAGVQAIWDALTAALTTVGSIGKLLVDNVNATIGSRSSHAAADVWSVVTRVLTAGTNIVLAKGVGVTGFNDLSAAQVNAEADTALTDYDAPTHTEMTAELATADDAVIAVLGVAGAGLTAIPWNAAWDAEVESEALDALRTTLQDSVPADGTRPTYEQALYMLTQFMLERSVTATTVTVNKPDGVTALFTLTLNDATSPTSITRAT